MIELRFLSTLCSFGPGFLTERSVRSFVLMSPASFPNSLFCRASIGVLINPPIHPAHNLRCHRSRSPPILELTAAASTARSEAVADTVLEACSCCREESHGHPQIIGCTQCHNICHSDSRNFLRDPVLPSWFAETASKRVCESSRDNRDNSRGCFFHAKPA